MSDAPKPSLTADYPAAHSMDTQWFAVDQDGHVGFFNSGEEGGVPLGASNDWETDDDPEFAVLHALRFARLLASNVDFELPEQDPFTLPHQVVVLVDPPEGVDPTDLSTYLPELDGDFMAVVRAEPPVVLMSRIELGSQYIEDVRALAVVRGAWDLEEIEILLEHNQGPDGIFHFHSANPMGSANPYRYERNTTTTEAIRLDELPGAIRDKLRALQLQLEFEQTKVVKLNRFVRAKDIKTWHSR